MQVKDGTKDSRKRLISFLLNLVVTLLFSNNINNITIKAKLRDYKFINKNFGCTCPT